MAKSSAHFAGIFFFEVLGSLRRCTGGGGREQSNTLCMYLSLSLSRSCSLARALSLSRREQSPTRGGRRSASHGPLSMAGCLETNPPPPPKASHGSLSMAGWRIYSSSYLCIFIGGGGFMHLCNTNVMSPCLWPMYRYTHTHTHTHTHTYVYTYIHTYIYTYIYIHAYYIIVIYNMITNIFRNI
jgi:hypothetical protein